MSFEESLARDERLARGSNARIDARWGVDDLATFSSVTSNSCATDICNYIYETHGRFPAHVDAIYVPGVWLQAFTRRRKYDQKALQVIVPF
jgi:hypothetical protein